MVGKEDKRLSKFAAQLMVGDPQQRPSLLEWRNFLASPISDVAKDVSRPQRNMVEVVSLSVHVVPENVEA
jgi:hypothetical protein